jgi:hypothetical protein
LVLEVERRLASGAPRGFDELNSAHINSLKSFCDAVGESPDGAGPSEAAHNGAQMGIVAI